MCQSIYIISHIESKYAMFTLHIINMPVSLTSEQVYQYTTIIIISLSTELFQKYLYIIPSGHHNTQIKYCRQNQNYSCECYI